MNSVGSFFTGSSRSRSSASGANTSSTSTNKSGSNVPTANNAVKKAKPTGSYESKVKCPNNLAVRSPESYLSYHLMRLPVNTDNDFVNTVNQGIRNLGFVLSLIESDPNDPASFVPGVKLSSKIGKYFRGVVKPVSNMNEFFDIKFGKSISNSLSKTNIKYDGQSIYKVTTKTDSEYLKKGYGIYLDALHKTTWK